MTDGMGLNDPQELGDLREPMTLEQMARMYDRPRALVTISEDQEWAVLPSIGMSGESKWNILHRHLRPPTWINNDYTWSVHKTAEDTGQSADEVLAAWLAEKSG